MAEGIRKEIIFILHQMHYYKKWEVKQVCLVLQRQTFLTSDCALPLKDTVTQLLFCFSFGPNTKKTIDWCILTPNIWMVAYAKIIYYSLNVMF